MYSPIVDYIEPKTQQDLLQIGKFNALGENKMVEMDSWCGWMIGWMDGLANDCM